MTPTLRELQFCRVDNASASDRPTKLIVAEHGLIPSTSPGYARNKGATALAGSGSGSSTRTDTPVRDLIDRYLVYLARPPDGWLAGGRPPSNDRRDSSDRGRTPRRRRRRG